MRVIKSFCVILLLILIAAGFVGCGNGGRDEPPKLESFEIGYFTEDFFENYTLILIPFSYMVDVRGYVFVYTVFAEDGEINFVVEVARLGSDRALTNYLFAVIIPNEILAKYEIGDSKIFHTYTDLGGGEIVETCREWTIEIQPKRVDHRAGILVSGDAMIIFVGGDGDIVVVSDIKTFNSLIEVALGKSA